MKKFRTIAAISATVILLAGAAPASAQQPSASAMALAREITELKGSAALISPVINGVVESAKLTFLSINPNLQRDLDAVAATIRAEYAPRQTAIRESIAQIYTKHFSEAEMKEILAFYKSPIGIKLAAEEPKFVDESMQYLDDWSKKMADEVQEKFRTEMKKKGHVL
jgi:hypothetical protein